MGAVKRANVADGRSMLPPMPFGANVCIADETALLGRARIAQCASSLSLLFVRSHRSRVLGKATLSRPRWRTPLASAVTMVLWRRPLCLKLDAIALVTSTSPTRSERSTGTRSPVPRGGSFTVWRLLPSHRVPFRGPADGRTRIRHVDLPAAPG
jgi:hypothetical protein